MFLLRDRLTVLSGWVQSIDKEGDETVVHCRIEEGNWLADCDGGGATDRDPDHWLGMPLSLFDDFERPWLQVGAYISVNVHRDGLLPVIYKRLYTEKEIEARRAATEALIRSMEFWCCSEDAAEDGGGAISAEHDPILPADHPSK